MAAIPIASHHKCVNFGPSANMADMPAEVLVMIFVKLDSVTRTRCEGVCQRWMDILRQTLQLQRTVKIDFSIAHRNRANAVPRLEVDVNEYLSLYLSGLASKLAKMEVLILTDESSTDLHSSSKFQLHQTAGGYFFSGLYKLSVKSKLYKLVLHRILVDMPVIAFASTRFTNILFADVLIAHASLRRGGHDVCDCVDYDFHVDFAQLVLIADRWQSILQFRRQFWLSFPEERTKQLLGLVGSCADFDDGDLRELVRLVVDNEGLQSDEEERVENLLREGDAAFVESLVPSTKADLLAHLQLVTYEMDSTDFSMD